MIIWLASYPRSGNTFLRTLLYHYYRLESYGVYPENRRWRNQDERKFFELIGQVMPPKPLGEMMLEPRTYFTKTHELPQDDFPALYLVRDGRDALVSYAWFTLSLKDQTNRVDTSLFRETLRDLILSDAVFGGWSHHVLAWTQRRTLTTIIKFEDLIQAPRATLRQALASMDYRAKEVIDNEPPSFAELHQLWPQFFRQGQVGAWRRDMPPDLEDLFWQQHGQAMDQLGYMPTYNKDEIRTGQGWYPLENYAGESFHWIANDAELIIPTPTGRYSRLSLEVEPGPGLNGQSLQLYILNQAGQTVASAAEAIGRQTIEITLPIIPSQPTCFRLHVEGGGHSTPNDSRILNFRIFRFSWAELVEAP